MSDLLTRAKEIKNATEIGENTAERVGGVMVDMVESIMSAEEILTAQEAQINELKKRNNAEIPVYSGVVAIATIKSGSVTQYSGVHFIKSEGRFAAKQGSEYFANWLAYGGYQAQPVYHQDNKAVPNRLYNLIALSGGGLHYFDGTSFKAVNDNADVEEAIKTNKGAIMLLRSVMGGNTQVIEWSHTHNMNDYKDAGTYRIKGERTGNPMDDNLPIMNSGSGHTIDGILYVLDSSLPTGGVSQDDKCVTQFLMLSNRVGGQEGDMYMRSAYGPNKDSLIWKPWEKYQTNMEVGVVSNDATHEPKAPFNPINTNGLNSFVDNGIYSGVYLTEEVLKGDATKVQTFVMVVINDYAAAGDYKTFTQIKFAVTNAGEYSMERRRRGFNGKWSGWINEYNDLSARIDEIEEEVATKQQELTLTVLDNGNIRIGNLQGQTKDFMPATPSGDPMHYAYEAMGAVYNSGADVIALTPWASLVDDADYNAKWGLNLIPDDATFVKTLKYNGADREVWQMKHPNKNMQIWVVAEYASDGTKIWDDTLVVKRSGMWYMNGLGDLTNQHMSMIMLDGRPETSVGSGALNKGRILRQTNGLINTTLPDYYAYFNQNFEVIVLGLNVTTSNGVCLFNVGSTRCFVHTVEGSISIRQPFAGSKLSCGFFAFLHSLNFNAEVISARSIIYALNNTTDTVTITFPSALYDRLMDTSTTLGAELVALLESKSNITFARGE